jgi:hypothetical protein
MAQWLNTDAGAPARAKANGDAFLGEASAVALYSFATYFDGAETIYPPQDTGSSGLAVMKSAKHFGYLSAYKHAFGFDHFLDSLALQPVIVGTAFTADMETPDSTGLVHTTGKVVGGHEYLALGYDDSNRLVTFLNSWSSGWGVEGRFQVSYNEFSALLADKGDVGVPTL